MYLTEHTYLELKIILSTKNGKKWNEYSKAI